MLRRDENTSADLAKNMKRRCGQDSVVPR